MKTAILLLLCAAPAGLFAQDDNTAAEHGDDDYAYLMEDEEGITLSESPGGDPAVPEISPYGQRNVLGRETIEGQGSHDLLDALRNVPGVSFSKRNSVGGDTGTSLYIRGRGASHPSVETVTTFDGVPRNGAIYGQSMPDSFSPGIAESITVYKSPQPSAFGAGYALVDVAPRFMKDQGWEAETGASLGSFLAAAETASFGFKRGAFDVYAAQSWTSTEGHREHSAAYQQSYYLNSGWAFNANWNLRALANYVNARSERPRRLDQNPLEVLPSFYTSSFLGTLTVNNDYPRAGGYLKLYYSGTDFYWLDENPSPSPRSEKDYYSLQTLKMPGLRFKETLRPWEGGEIIAGGDLDLTLTSNYDNNDDGPAVLSRFPSMLLMSPYLAASHTFSFGREGAFYLTPQAGARGYLHTLWANAFAPQFGLTAGYRDTQIYGNYVLGFVYPAPANIQGLVNQGLPDEDALKDIKPEVVYHYEAGLSQSLWNRITLGGSFFFDDGRNRIIAAGRVPENASLVSYFRISGVELYGSATPLTDLDLFVGGTWMKVEARGEDGAAVTRMPFTPDLSLAAGFTWRLSCFGIQALEGLTLAADYRFLGGLYANTNLQFSAGFINSGDTSRLEDQHILHLRLSWASSYPKWRMDRVEIFADINNVLNHNYHYWPGYPMPGITFAGGLNLRFK
jgi:iron complex outermembrane receptor protein